MQARFCNCGAGSSDVSGPDAALWCKAQRIDVADIHRDRVDPQVLHIGSRAPYLNHGLFGKCARARTGGRARIFTNSISVLSLRYHESLQNFVHLQHDATAVSPT